MVINRLYLLYLFCFNRKYTNTRIKGDMKKSIILIITLAFLNGCAEYSALVGPSFTLAKSGSIVQTSSSYAASYGIKKATGKSLGEHALSLSKKSKKNDKSDTLLTEDDSVLLAQNDNTRECETTHSSSLSEVFFDTQNEIDCLRDPFSSLK